jgi:hypothetical protein
MSTITVRYAYCPEHTARHMVDERERHIANDTAEMKAKGFFYLRHIGGGWYSYRAPRALPLDWQMTQEPEPPEHYQELDPELF